MMLNHAITQKHLDPDLRRSRTAALALTVMHNGAPLAHQEITVEQTRHKFLFGSTWGDSTVSLVNGELSGAAAERAEQRNAHFLALFNQATLPFYWARFEPVRGQPDTERIRNTARWYRDQGCVTKGHPLCWHTLTAEWLLTMSNAEIRADQLARITRDVTAFAGVIDMWDVVNEAVIMPIFDRYDNGITRLCKATGRIELIRMMFEAARAANPNSVLLLNDFDVSPAFDILVEGCLAAGIQIDAIGIQSHMHQGYWGVERTLAVLERFERFKLPIHFTETTLISGELMPPHIVDLNDYQVDEWPTTPEGEAWQAEEVIQHYTTLVAHPLVEAITWWDMTDGGWLNAPAGLLRADQSPKPAYHELLRRIKGEWWLAPTTITTNGEGQVTVEGFLGDYRLSVGDQSVPFSIERTGQAAVTLTV